MIVENSDAKAKRCQALLSNECSYINPVTAWKRLEEDARKELAQNNTSMVVHHKFSSTAVINQLPNIVPRLNLN